MFFPNICNEELSYRKLLSEQDGSFDYIYKVYVDSFPEDERRTKEQFIEEMLNPQANVGVISYKGEDIGLFVFWDLEEFIYGGHLAIDAAQRGKQIGDKFLKELLRQLPKPMVIEVEKPETEIAKRRIAFYQRLGIHLCENENYFQPIYRESGQTVPLYLMEAPAQTTELKNDAVLLLTTKFETIKQQLYDIVYKGCKYDTFPLK